MYLILITLNKFSVITLKRIRNIISLFDSKLTIHTQFIRKTSKTLCGHVELSSKAYTGKNLA